MKKIIAILILALMLVAIPANVAAKGQKETATAVFNVEPKMSCANCENKVKTNLRYAKGVTNIATSLEAQTVTVTYDPAKTDVPTLIEAFKKIGYTATQVPANCRPAAGGCDGCRQPRECPGCPGHK